MVVIGLVLATAILLLLAYTTRRVLVWLLISAFFAVALDPVVSWLEGRARWLRRSVATLLVYLVAAVVGAAILTAIVVPLVREAVHLVDQLPHTVQQARSGQGPVGRLLVRTHLLDYLHRHADQIREQASRFGAPATAVLAGTANVVAGTITVFVVSFLMVLQGPRLKAATLRQFAPGRRARIGRVGRQCGRAITGYLTGNLLISLIVGVLTWLVLALLKVPFSGLLGLLVAILDLLPLVGATLGAVIASAVAFLHSTTAGIITVVFFVVYQQIENHVLQPLIMSRVVRLSPLTVLVAILIAADLAGILGALLAVPAASMIQTILRESWPDLRGTAGAGPPPPSPPPGASPAPETGG